MSYTDIFNSNNKTAQDLTQKMSQIQLDTEADPVETQARINKHYSELNKNFQTENTQTEDSFTKNENQTVQNNNEAQLTTYAPSTPVINQNCQYQVPMYNYQPVQYQQVASYPLTAAYGGGQYYYNNPQAQQYVSYQEPVQYAQNQTTAAQTAAQS